MKKEFFKLLGSAGGTLLSAIAGVILVKMISLSHGPAGLGAFGLIRQFFQLSSVFLSLGNGASVISAVAANANQNETTRRVCTYFLFALLIATLIFFLSSDKISSLFSENNSWTEYILTTPLTFFFIGCFLIIRYTLSGLGYSTISAIFQSFPFITMATLFYFMTIYDISKNFFLMFLSGYGLAFIFSLFFFKYNFKGFSFTPQLKHFQRDFLFEKTSLITFASSGIGFCSFLAVKSLTSKYFGMTKTGLLEAAWSISSYSSLVFLSGLTLYFLPRLKQERNPAFAKRIYFLIANLTFLLMLLVIALKAFIIPILFSKSFLSTQDILEFMLIGDYLRSTNWLFMFTFIALNSKKKFIAADIIGNIFFVLFSYFALEYFGIFRYLGIAYLGYQLIYFIVSIYLISKLNFLPIKYIIITSMIHFSILALASLFF